MTRAKGEMEEGGKGRGLGEGERKRYGEDKVSNNEVVERDAVAQSSKRGIES